MNNPLMNTPAFEPATVDGMLQGFSIRLDELIQERVERTHIPPLQIIAQHPDKVITIDGFVNPQLPKILAAIQQNIPISFIGGSGTGKTTLASQLATILDKEFYCITITEGMDESALLGGLNPLPSGGFEYTETPFLHAVENGGMLLIDEFDAIDANTALVLNNIMEFGRLDLPMRTSNPTIVRHPDFRLVVCCNTHMNGPSVIHSGRNQLDGATVSRFDGGIFFINYEPMLELLLCPRDYLRNTFLGLRKQVQDKQIPREISTRTLLRAEKLWSTGAWSSVKELLLHFISSWTPEEREQLDSDFLDAVEETVTERDKLEEERKQADASALKQLAQYQEDLKEKDTRLSQFYSNQYDQCMPTLEGNNISINMGSTEENGS